MIIGLTGPNGAGKTGAGMILKEKGFEFYSLSDEIRGVLKKEGKELITENLIKKGNELRLLFGSHFLAELVSRRFQDGKNYAIDSIRNTSEVKYFKKRKDFVLVKVDAPLKVRYSRVKTRGRDGKLLSFQEFINLEKKATSNDSAGQQLKQCEKMADLILNNNSNLDILRKKIDDMLKYIIRTYINKRPNWDEYFMNIAREIGRRATCDRGRSGSVIVRDKRILTTGYVGSPVGLAHCDDVGHLMIEVLNEDGSRSDHCIRTTHAEQNAMIQAARFGIPLQGSTIYCKMTPCHVCAKMIINAGIKRVVCERDYQASRL